MTKKGDVFMTEHIEKLEAKIKALQAKKREATKKEKAKQQKVEFERLKAVENESGAFPLHSFSASL